MEGIGQNGMGGNPFSEIANSRHRRHRETPAGAEAPAGQAGAPKERKEIELKAEVYDAYVGEYEVVPQFVLTVTAEGEVSGNLEV